MTAIKKEIDLKRIRTDLTRSKIITDTMGHIEYLHRYSHSSSYIKIENLQPSQGNKRYYGWRLSQSKSAIRARIEELKDINDELFITINPLYHFKRKSENVSNYNFVWADLDKPEGAADDWYYDALDQINTEIFDKDILPPPSGYVFSGTGIWLQWRLDGKSSTQHSREARNFNIVQHGINKALRKFNADPSAVDPARLMRLAGSINKKNGRQVMILEADPTPFNLQELTETYFPNAKQPAPSRSPKPAAKAKENIQESHADISAAQKTTAGSKSNPKKYTIGSLLKARMADLQQLVEIRNGKMTGMRNFTLYTYAYHALKLYNTDPNDVWNDLQDINNRFSEALPSHKISSAFMSALARPKDRLPKNNSNLVAELAITSEEQQGMRTLIDGETKAAREMARRRAAGIKSKEEYQQSRKNKQQERVEQLRQLIEENPDITNKQLQELLGVSRPTVHRLKKLLK